MTLGRRRSRSRRNKRGNAVKCRQRYKTKTTFLKRAFFFKLHLNVIFDFFLASKFVDVYL